MFRIAGVLLVSIMASCAKPGSSPAKVDPALLSMIPPDTILLAAVDADGLRKTQLYQKQLGQRDYPQLDEFSRYTGMDPRKDLWELLFVSDGKHNVLLGRGRFREDMESHLQGQGAQVIPYKMYHLVAKDGGAVVFLSGSTAAVGEVESLKALLDARGKTNGPPAAIAEQMKTIPASSQIWIVYTGGGAKLPFDLKGNLGNADRVAQSVQTATLFFDVSNGVKGQARLLTPAEADGKKLNETIRGLIGFGRLSVPSNKPDLVRLFDGLQVTQEGTKVTLNIDVAQDLIEEFLK